MREHPPPDCSSVYHENHSNGRRDRAGTGASAATARAAPESAEAGGPGQLRDDPGRAVPTRPRLFPDPDALDGERVRPPRRFALCEALPEYPADSFDEDDHDADASDKEAAGNGDDHGARGPHTNSAATDGCLVEEIGPDEIDVLDLEAIVMWGLEGDDQTYVCGRNPYTHRLIHGTFSSAERARAFYSRWGLLRLVYA